MGDQVRFLQIPSVPLTEKTRQIYATLVTQRSVVAVYEIDPSGYPVIEYCADDREGKVHYHWLSIDGFDQWEWVASSKGGEAGTEEV